MEKRDRCVAPRADACSHFRTDTAAVYSPSVPKRRGGCGVARRERGETARAERDVTTPLAPAL